MIGQVQALPVVADEVVATTRTDSLLSKIWVCSERMAL